MKMNILKSISLAAGLLFFNGCIPTQSHMAYDCIKKKVDSTVKAAEKLELKAPVMCREFHIWWGSPHGVRPTIPQWSHWKGLRRFGKIDAETTINETIPGSAWRRYLNCVGYPLLGPYDSGQPDIIRWQLETAKNAGIECLHVQLWPSLWDNGQDFYPISIFDKVLQTAATMNYPVGVHDEIQFRSPKITKAQALDNCIKRATIILERYGKHPGWYKINGMPIYYFQNWSKWISAADMEKFFCAVEKKVGPVYWMVEMSDIEEYVKIPQIKVLFSHHYGWFRFVEPWGKPPFPWDRLRKLMSRSARLARKYHKKFGIIVYTRFNNNNDRGRPGRSRTDADNGMFYVKCLKDAKTYNPDFIVVTQWNDYEEGAFIEPAWDYDGNNGDPYRYCRITAAAVGKNFTPAKLPKREELDPFIRHKLFGDTKKGDAGPVMQFCKLMGKTLSWRWGKGSGAPASIQLYQDGLMRWTPATGPFNSINLANLSYIEKDGGIANNKELIFYIPGFTPAEPSTVWIGIRVTCGKKTFIKITYRSYDENFRTGSRWESRHVSTKGCAFISCNDGSRLYWQPMHGVLFNGAPGDIRLRVTGKKGKAVLHEIIMWNAGQKARLDTQCDWQQTSLTVAPIITAKPFVVVARDSAGNPGLPRLFYDHETTPQSLKDPMAFE